MPCKKSYTGESCNKFDVFVLFQDKVKIYVF